MPFLAFRLCDIRIGTRHKLYERDPKHWTMRTLTTFMSAALLAAAICAQNITERSVNTGNTGNNKTVSIHFASASAELNDEARQTLVDLCGKVGNSDPWSITLSGHTDDVGDAAYNIALSHRRADAVRAAMRDVCPALADAEITWQGEAKPVADNSAEPGRAKNRRVDVAVVFEPPDAFAGSPAQPLTFAGIKPLMPAVDKRPQVFTVNASGVIDLLTAEGWSIHIPAGAIVDAEGRPVTGDVQISCRGFFTPAEAIASGIPMYVGHGDEAGHMETAGMYEVLAAQNKAPVHLRAGERITIERPMTNVALEGYNNYMLDGATGQWREEGPVMTATLMESIVPVFDGGPQTSWMAYQAAMGLIRPKVDTLDFEERQAAPGYCLTATCMPMPDEKSQRKGRVFSVDHTDQIPNISLRLDHRGAAGRDRIGFHIMVDRSWLHPEWAVLGEEKVWVYAGELTRRAFVDSMARHRCFQDIILEARAGEERGVIRLKSQGKWTEVPVDLRSYGHTTVDAKNWARTMDVFHHRLEAKQRRFNQHNATQVAADKRRLDRLKQKVYADVRPLMTAEERAMSLPDWNVYALAKCNEYWARILGENKGAVVITASFQMSGFGIYNCDHILQQEAVMASTVAVVDEDKRAFPWHTAYGVLEKSNAVITYWGNGTGKQDQMRLSREMTSVVFVGPDNELLVIKNPARQISGTAKAVLTGARTPQPTTKDALDALVMR